MHWFTLEALAMAGSTNIAPMQTALARIYEAPPDEAKQRFMIGPIYRLRGDIVHRGVQPAIHARLIDFIAAVYWDLLLDKLGLPPRHAAGRLIATDPSRSWAPGTR